MLSSHRFGRPPALTHSVRAGVPFRSDVVGIRHQRVHDRHVQRVRYSGVVNRLLITLLRSFPDALRGKTSTKATPTGHL